MKRLAAIALAVLSSGCGLFTVERVSVDYRNVELSLAAVGSDVAAVDSGIAPVFSNVLAVMVHDRRKPVLEGDVSATWCGYARSPIGVRWSVPTASNAPLAEEMSRAIAAGLERGGLQTKLVLVTHDESLAVAREKLQAAGGRLGLHFTLTEWMHRTWGEMDVAYDLSLNVVDPDGHVVARASSRGQEHFEKRAFRLPDHPRVWSAHEHAAQVMPGIFKRSAETLLGHRQVRAAIEGR